MINELNDMYRCPHCRVGWTVRKKGIESQEGIAYVTECLECKRLGTVVWSCIKLANVEPFSRDWGNE